MITPIAKLIHNNFTNGEAPLWKAFWLFLVGGHLILLAAEASIFFGLASVSNSPLNATVWIIVFWSSHLLYSIYCVYVLWRCRRNTNWPGWSYLGFSAGIINSIWLVVMLGIFLSVIFDMGQNSTKNFLSTAQTSPVVIKRARDARPEDTTTKIGWIGLWNDEMLDWAEGKNIRPKSWAINVYQKPSSEAKLLGSIIVTVKPQSAIEFSYRAISTSLSVQFTPDIYEQDWGYGPYMHQTFTERKNMWFKLPRIPITAGGWINGKEISKRSRVNVLPIKEKHIYKLDGKNIFIDRIDQKAIYYRPEQKADFWCFEGSPPPLKNVALTKTSIQSLYGDDGHLALKIVYTKGC